jgi:DNA repair exonuclease SbcCD ATPase subunit
MITSKIKSETAGNERGEGALKWVAVLCVVALAGLSAFLWAQQNRSKAQVVELQAQLATAEATRQKLEEQVAAAEEAQKGGSQDNLELVRLRGEVASLRPLQKQVQQLQSENQQFKATVQQLQQSASESAALRTQNQQLQGAMQNKAQVDACINNLRTIEAAKAAWAAQFQKQPTDTPTEDDLFGPGKPLPQKPVCPANGIYTLNQVQVKATCTIPGHVH